MKLFIGEENSELIANTIASIVNNYSKSEKIDSIFMNCYLENSANIYSTKIPTIRLSITYTDKNPLSRSEISSIETQIKELQTKTNIKVSVDINESSKYGLLDLYILSCGGLSCCSRLIDGEILFDRKGKFRELQINSRRIQNSKKRHLTPIEFEPALNISNTLKHPNKSPKIKSKSPLVS